MGRRKITNKQEALAAVRHNGRALQFEPEGLREEVKKGIGVREL